jgi:redox-sensitive bicupin YhaK (pirin superfamily)
VRASPFAGVDLRALDPFVHMDQMGEVDYAPGEPKGTPWHPHRGFETVTYMIDGTFQHQDSNGGGGLITDGDTQWMTAGVRAHWRERVAEQHCMAKQATRGSARNLGALLAWEPPGHCGHDD